MSNPWYAWYPADYAMKTQWLSDLEDLAYRRLLDAYYAGGEAIKDGRQYRLARASTVEMRAAVDAVLVEFFMLNGDGRWHQRRADEEIEKQRDLRQKKSEGGKRAQERRRGQIQDSVKTAQGVSQDCFKTEQVATATTTTTPSSLRSEGTSTTPPPSASRLGSKASPSGDDIKAYLFSGPIDYLVAKGLTEARSKSLVGKLIKSIGEEHTFELFTRCMEVGPVEPVAWLRGGEKHYKREKDRLEFHLQAFGSGGKPIQPYDGPEDGNG